MGCSCGKSPVTVRSRHCVRDMTGDSRSGFGSKHLQLTSTQKAVLKNAWQILKVQIANVGVQTFINLFENRPDLVESFSAFRGKRLDDLRITGLLRSHGLRVMAIIDSCIDNLHNTAAMEATLHHIGAIHKANNVNSTHIQSILPHFLDAVKPHIEDFWSEDMRKAWEVLFETILYHLRVEMEKKTPIKRPMKSPIKTVTSNGEQ